MYKATVHDLGRSLAVVHASAGGKLVPTKAVDKRKIVEVYHSGQVKDEAGDVWYIRPYTKYGTTFVTVR